MEVTAEYVYFTLLTIIFVAYSFPVNDTNSERCYNNHKPGIQQRVSPMSIYRGMGGKISFGQAVYQEYL